MIKNGPVCKKMVNVHSQCSHVKVCNVLENILKSSLKDRHGFKHCSVTFLKERPPLYHILWTQINFKKSCKLRSLPWREVKEHFYKSMVSFRRTIPKHAWKDYSIWQTCFLPLSPHNKIPPCVGPLNHCSKDLLTKCLCWSLLLCIFLKVGLQHTRLILPKVWMLVLQPLSIKQKGNAILRFSNPK